MFANGLSFGTPSFGMVGLQNLNDEERAHVLNPMASTYAQQAATFAQQQPGNAEALRTAQYWAAVVQRQQMVQQHHQAQPLLAPTAPPTPPQTFAVPSTFAPTTTHTAPTPLHATQAQPNATWVSRVPDSQTGTAFHHGSRGGEVPLQLPEARAHS